MPPASSTARRKANPLLDALAHPLDEFYARQRLHLPRLERVDGDQMPQPYRQLLVHTNDMTPTLEHFHQQEIHLEILGRRRKDDDYFREVVLLLDGDNRPVEFGAIKIHLGLFPQAARDQILAERRPLGHILQECRLKHSSRPQAFLRVTSDAFIEKALKLSGRQILYGRRNTLFDAARLPLAEIVEILPPCLHLVAQSQP